MRGRIPALTSLRFLAALWVFLFHLHIWHGNTGISFIDKVLLSGAVGMAFFFVLSGFILALSAFGQDLLANFRGYAIRRFSKIYPTYLFVLVASYMLNGFAGPLGERPFLSALAHLFSDLTLTTAWFPQCFMGGTSAMVRGRYPVRHSFTRYSRLYISMHKALRIARSLRGSV